MDEPAGIDNPLGYVIGWKAMNFSLPGWIHTEVVKEVLPGRERWNAKCRYAKHEDGLIPHPSCTCGWYAWKHKTWRADYGRELYVKLAMWGKVIEASDGYRSEFCYPLEIDVVRGTFAEPYVFFLQDRYGVPCRLVDAECSQRVYEVGAASINTTQPRSQPLRTEDLIRLYNSDMPTEDKLIVARELLKRLYGMKQRVGKRVDSLLTTYYEAVNKQAQLAKFTEKIRDYVTNQKKG